MSTGRSAGVEGAPIFQLAFSPRDTDERMPLICECPSHSSTLAPTKTRPEGRVHSRRVLKVASFAEIRDYAAKIGIDPDAEPQLLPLAAEGLMKALPPGWKPW
ncbi:hypothetical protein Zmor_009255 [Zophobas morio]|uniref:Uncharacterized protein n=1 Tax=Zophobas morio TaxID=2755281 RepID=A0AA38ILL9_9CUCU|nr:hypothetical protein Zmor_009255 [Zophobas morio]